MEKWRDILYGGIGLIRGLVEQGLIVYDIQNFVVLASVIEHTV